jgi:hypothetical protein
MKSLKLFLIVAITSISLYSCDDSTAQNRVTVSHPKPQDISVQSNDIPGFNVNRFADLLKTTSSPDALTQAINANGNDINNLDLDEDGQIDYLKVDQVNANTLAVYDETSNDKVEICKLTVNTQNNSYSVVGSPQYCGNTYVYHSSPGLTFGQYMFLSWMLTPHPYYHPYWGYHRGYYGGYRPYYSHYSRPYTRTYSRTRTVTRTVPSSTVRTTTRSTPSQVRSTSSVRSTPQRTSVSNPVRSQRAFTRGEGNRYRSSGATGSGFRSSSSSSSSRGGFGSSSRSSSRSSSSFGSSRSSSRSSFGSSRSSFGGGRSSGRRR